jgi:hypothetical protein
MAANEMRTFDWDDVSTITEEEERGGAESVILPDGKYPFEVIKVEKAVYDGSAKIPPCNMAKVFLRVDGGELGTSLVVENIYLAEKYQWKAAAFLRSIGLKKHGEDIQWRKLVQCDGETGRCEIYVDEYEGKDGHTKQSNKLRKFFDKEEEAPKKAFKKGAF